MDKKQLLYIHGGQAFSNYKDFLNRLRTASLYDPLQERLPIWSDTIREDLPEFAVYKPVMPNKQNAKYEEWRIWFERHLEFLKDGASLAGWSQGGYFLAKYLTENDLPIKLDKLFLIAAPAEREDFNGEDGGDFVFDQSKLPRLATSAEQIYILHSKDDPVVPYRHASIFAAALPEARLVSFDDRGHFINAQFPELLALISS